MKGTALTNLCMYSMENHSLQSLKKTIDTCAGALNNSSIGGKLECGEFRVWALSAAHTCFF